ncbi:MAG: DUF971 domain-containing protein [Rhodospirillales bacterium]|jgi:DUF971 family protein|nr:DUF971 domain-containing protein [Rhodospirillales bacterium]
MSDFGTKIKPTEIRLKREEKALEVDFADGRSFHYPAEFLRVESPSAEVQGHSPSQKTLVAGRKHVGIIDLEPVGNYAIRIKFDDLHDTGLFTWDLLYEYGLEQDERWQNYLTALKESGLSRDPEKAPRL